MRPALARCTAIDRVVRVESLVEQVGQATHQVGELCPGQPGRLSQQAHLPDDPHRCQYERLISQPRTDDAVVYYGGHGAYAKDPSLAETKRVKLGDQVWKVNAAEAASVAATIEAAMTEAKVIQRQGGAPVAEVWFRL